MGQRRHSLEHRVTDGLEVLVIKSSIGHGRSQSLSQVIPVHRRQREVLFDAAQLDVVFDQTVQSGRHMHNTPERRSKRRDRTHAQRIGSSAETGRRNFGCLRWDQSVGWSRPWIHVNDRFGDLLVETVVVRSGTILGISVAMREDQVSSK